RSATVGDASGPVGTVIQAAIGQPIRAGGGSVALAQPEPVAEAELLFGAVLADEPPADTPEWADLYARAQVRVTQERERLEREQLQAQQLWEEFLRSAGEEVAEGERSLVTDDELHQQLQRLARTA